MLEQIFRKVIDMSLAASLIILIVFLARVLLKRFPKYISYMLWSVVLFRLLCPFTLESKISIVPDLKPAFYEYVSEKDGVFTEASEDFAVPYTGGETKDELDAAQVMPSQSHSDRNTGKDADIFWKKLFVLFGKYVWISGIGVMLLYSVISFVKIRNKVLVSIPFKDNIYITDEPVTPFVMGIFNPKIYLPGCLSEKEQEYIILHEQFHIRRFDHIVKPVAFVALCLHWFNPLVWIAFILFCKDMEMSCDEAVVKKMGENIRADYSASLLALSTKHCIVRGMSVNFGEGDTKSRVKNLAAFRKTNKGVLAVLTAGVIILIVCLASTHKLSHSDSIENEKEQYNLLNLSIGDDEQKVIDLYGEPEAIDHEVIGDYLLTDQCLYTYMIYNDKTITIRKYFDESKSYDCQNGIIEMDIHDGDYETTEGIHIGSSIDDVIKKYNINQIYDKEHDGGELDVPKAIWARTSNSGSIRHNSEYGDFEEIAYIQSGVKFEDHNNIPALIFLIHDGKVSHIIVMNTVQYTLS